MWEVAPLANEAVGGGREVEMVLALLGTLVETEEQGAEYEIEDDEDDDEDLPTAPPGGTLLSDAATGLYDAVYNDLDISTITPVVVDPLHRRWPARAEVNSWNHRTQHVRPSRCGWHHR